MLIVSMLNNRLCWLLCLAVTVGSHASSQEPSRDEISRSLRKATKFMTEVVADHGGYAWVSGPDGKLSHGEGVCGPDRVWVQPPGTPAVGIAFLDAHRATGDSLHLAAARDVGRALLNGQLRSGGWGYSITFSKEERRLIPYRVGPNGGADRIAKTPAPGGWEIWRKRKLKSNMTLIDDDTTPAAIRFLVRLDQVSAFSDPKIHEACQYALESTLKAQYPVGAWGHNYDRFPVRTPDVNHYPVLSASYPDEWPGTWPKAYAGCYAINDRITMNMIETMLLAWKVYGDDRFRSSAIRGGEFLLRAQLPEPQPAWAQQYDRHMHPVWERKFEPPAVTAGESQDVLRTLMRLYRATGDKRFMEPIPRAVEYLRSCLRPDGRLARFYELKTNAPLYFDAKYRLTNDDSQAPDHYGFVVESRLDQIEREYRYAKQGTSPSASSKVTRLNRARDVIMQQAESGAWLTPGYVRDASAKKVVPEAGVVDSHNFVRNVRALCEALKP